MLTRGLSIVTAARRKRSASRREREKKQVVDITKGFRKKTSSSTLVKFATTTEAFTTISPNEVIKKFGRDALRVLPPDYELSRFLGEGLYGSTYQICATNFDCLAVKFQKMKQNKSVYENEVKIQQLFASHGLAPKVIGNILYTKHKNKPIASYLMERIDGTLKSLLKKPNLSDDSLLQIISALLTLIGKFQEYKLTHGDFHTENIAYQWKTDSEGVSHVQFLAIDFGRSRSGKANIKMDLLQLVRTLLWFNTDVTPKHYRETISKPFIDLLQNTYGHTDFSEKGLTKPYFKMVEESE